MSSLGLFNIQNCLFFLATDWMNALYIMTAVLISSSDVYQFRFSLTMTRCNHDLLTGYLYSTYELTQSRILPSLQRPLDL